MIPLPAVNTRRKSGELVETVPILSNQYHIERRRVGREAGWEDGGSFKPTLTSMRQKNQLLSGQVLLTPLS